MRETGLVGPSEWRRFLLEEIQGGFCGGFRGILYLWIGRAVVWILIVCSLLYFASFVARPFDSFFFLVFFEELSILNFSRRKAPIEAASSALNAHCNFLSNGIHKFSF